MRRGLVSSLFGVLATAGLAAAQPASPPAPTSPPPTAALDSPTTAPPGAKIVTPVIPMRSDAGIPFEVRSDAYVQPCDRDVPPEEFTPRFWVSAEYLMRWLKDPPLGGPLVTSSTVDPFTNPGVLGQDGTVVLFDHIPGLGMYSGVRGSAGVALDRCHTWVLDGSILWLQERNKSVVFQSDGNGNPVISRPIINPDTREEGVFLVSFPDNFAGRINIQARQQFWAVETNVSRKLISADWGGIDLIGGFRYAALSEDLTIDDQSLVLPLSGQGGRFLGEIIGPDNILSKNDTFETRNQFYGGQLGLKAEVRRGNWYLLTKTQLGFGDTYQSLNISGSSTLTPPFGAPTTVPGGLLALPTNMGRVTHNELTLLPELSVSLGYQVSEGIRLYVGYDLTYWSNVVRPGDQIDRNINRSYVPTSEFFGGPAFPQDPVILFRTTDWWMQGINFGVAVRF
jgi:putative beta barrel porin BBP7